jgi:membrane protease YdiL (CAAX protease family)
VRGAASISERSPFVEPAALTRLWAFLAVLFAAWIGRLAALPYTDLAADSVSAARIVADLWRLLVWLAVPLVWLAWVERLDPRVAIDQRPGDRVWLGWAAAFATVAAARGLDVLGGSTWIAIPDVPASRFFVVAVGLALAALCDEFVFRGLVLKALRGRMGFWAANAVSAALYAAILVPGWLATVELDLFTLGYLFVSVLLFGLLLGWFVRLTGTIWPAVLAHFLNDLLQGFGFA